MTCCHGRFVALVAGTSLLAAGTLRANTEDDVLSGLPTNSTLNVASSYSTTAPSTGGAPTTTSDVVFTAAGDYSAGTFNINPALSIGSLNDLSATAITLRNNNSTTAAPLTLNGGDSVSGNTADLLYVATGANLTILAANTVSVALGNSGNFNVAGTATISAPITGAFALNKTGAGTLTIGTTANTFSGGTTVSAGTLSLAAGGGTGALQGVVTVNAGATLNLANGDALGYNAGAQITTLNVNGGTVTSVAGNNEGYLTNFNLTGGTVAAGSLYRFFVNAATPPGITSLASATTSTFAANIDDYPAGVTGGSLALNVAAGTTASGVDLTISGIIAQSGGTGPTGITKTGAGYLNLSGQNTFSGPVIITGGTVNVGVTGINGGGSGALGLSNAGKTITVNAGATLSGTTTNWFGNQANTGTMPTIIVNGGTLSVARYTALGALNLNGATVTTTDTIDTGNYQTYQFRGDVTVGGAAASTMTTTTATATTGGVHLGANTTFTVADATGNANVDLTVSAPLRDQSGDFGNVAGGLTKAGAGTMMLTATNTYTGATTVNAGSLIVTGRTSTSSTVTVNNAGSVLGGTGIIAGNITVGNGAILSAGNRALATPAGIGTLTTGPLTLSLGSTVNFLVASGTNFSSLNNAFGTTDISGAAFSITLASGATFTNGARLQKVIASDVTGTTFTNTTYTVGSYRFTADYTTDPGFFDLSVAAVPEPSTWVCGLVMAGLVGVSCRRKMARVG